jgi:hypothetical protein
VRRRVSVIAVLAVSGMLVGVEGANACSCLPPPPKKQLRMSDGAFNARLLSVQPVGDSMWADFRYRVRLAVKGPLRRGSIVTVRSLRYDTLCGLPHGKGRVYGLFAFRRRGRWHSSFCAIVPPKTMRRLARGGDPPPSGCSEERT